MENLLTVRLEAHHTERNHHRFYELRLGHDLFGLWMLTLHYGRTGRNGHLRQFSSSDASILRSQIQQCLRVRETAPRRLGCRYRLVSMEQADGFPVSHWFPEERLQPFR